MEELHNETLQERAVLVGLNADCFTKEQTATDQTLEELEALLETAGGFCTGKILQNRHAPDAHSFIGAPVLVYMFMRGPTAQFPAC